MESPVMYVELYVCAHDQAFLQSRIAPPELCANALEGFRGTRFAIRLVCNRSCVGAGVYDYTGKTPLIEHEKGAGVGLLERGFRIT
jgi:hypothetical protein